MGIVVGYLATPEGRAALEAAIDEGKRRDERVVVVVSMRRDATDEEQMQVETELNAVRAELVSRNVVYDVLVLDGGDVADDLIRTAEELGAELIVIGLRRRSPVGKLILGANAQRVLFDAPCPVLTVKPPLA
ncbi:universal stress protein [Cellulomonas soli]|uniref:Universal stress protein n=1 Tax=Cellulomonas soli TaxID=931535 RepID=A0A512P9T6_9CELL|nr:universal stress protein [Cellulomonas soli]NYI60446.1 nucleotide-binding universal stress UspA family protein [Cellulomonas soli]GEP67961.1 universal stress protein [Cellulomonas soli]